MLREEMLPRAYFRDRNVADIAAGPGGRRGPGDSRRMILGRLLLVCLPVLLFLLVIDTLVRFAFPPEKLLPFMQAEAAVYSRKVAAFLSRPPPDVLFIGSSRMRNAVIPKRFAASLSQHLGRPARAYNLGLMGAKLEEYLAIVYSHMPDPPPAYVVIGLSGTEVVRAHHFTYASRFLWRTPDIAGYLRRTPFAKLKAKRVEQYIESVISRSWYLLENRYALSSMMYHVLDPSFIHEKEMVQRGGLKGNFPSQVLSEDGYAPPPGPVPLLNVQLRADPDSVLIHAGALWDDPKIFGEEGAGLLRKITSKIRGMKSKVAIVETPPSPHLQKLGPVVNSVPFREWMTETAKELGVLFVPFPPEETGLTDQYYMDANHLTPEGAKRYTYHLFNKLMRAGFFDG